MIYIMVVTGVILKLLIIENHSPQPFAKLQNVFTLDDYAEKILFLLLEHFLRNTVSCVYLR